MSEEQWGHSAYAVVAPPSEPPRPVLARLGRELLKLVTAILIVAGGLAGLVRVLFPGPPEIPANAAIDFGTTWQVGSASDAAGRVCEARRTEFEEGSTSFQGDLEAVLGSHGIGRPDQHLDDGSVLVFHADPQPMPVGEYITPPEPVFAYRMVKEGRRWRVCGLVPTDETVPGFDTRMPCVADESPSPRPTGCR